MLYNFYKSLPESLKGLTVVLFRNLHGFYNNHLVKQKYSGGSLDKQTFYSYNRQRLYGPRKKLCYAPYSSLFFSRAGFMSPCYATYSEKSDLWPETSINDAWFKGEISKIREHMSANDLDYACAFCKPLFISQNFGSLLPNKYESYSFSKSKFPQIMEFELSNRCNLECIMCDGNLSSAIRKNRDKLPPLKEVYDQHFVTELEPFIPHLKMAEFTGGDPFLIPIYYDIWETIHKLNPKCQILITTNANTMTPRIEKMLEQYANLHFNISIDSLNPGHYEKIRVHASYESVLQNIITFINYCHKHKNSCNLLVCPMTINSRDFQGLIEFANTNNICVHFHTVVKPKDLSLKYQTSEYLVELISYLGKYKPPENTILQRKNAANYYSLLKLIKTWCSENKDKLVQEGRLNSVEFILEHLKKNLPSTTYLRISRILNNYNHHPYFIRVLQKLYQINPFELEKIVLIETDEQLSQRIDELLNMEKNKNNE